MSTLALDDNPPRRPARDQALALAGERKAARRRRTGRLRKVVAAVALAAFIGPFAVIYAEARSGHDPGLSVSQTTAAATTSAPASTSSGSTSSSSGSTTSVSPAPVVTQQS